LSSAECWAANRESLSGEYLRPRSLRDIVVGYDRVVGAGRLTDPRQVLSEEPIAVTPFDGGWGRKPAMAEPPDKFARSGVLGLLRNERSHRNRQSA